MNGQIVVVNGRLGTIRRYSIERQAYLIEFESGVKQYVSEFLVD